jgi:hypothetical protein
MKMDLNQLKATLFFDAARRLANDPERLEFLISSLRLNMISKIRIEKKQEESNANQ